MSGGHFDYAYARVSQFVETLRYELDNNLARACVEDPVLLAKLNEVAAELEVVTEQMRAIEWFYSGDSGEARTLAALTAQKDPR